MATGDDSDAAGDSRDPRPAPPGTTGKPVRRGRRDETPVLPSISRDETDIGWGDEPGGRDDEWYRRERPPHHGG